MNCQYPQQRPQLYITMTTEQDHVSSQDTVGLYYRNNCVKCPYY